MNTKKTVLWAAFTWVPVIALWIYSSVAALEAYAGTCGPQSRGYRCTKWQYIQDHLFNAFVAPGLIAVSVTWLLVAALVAVGYFLWRKFASKG